MESQTTYYIGNQPNVQQGLHAVKGGTYIQPSTGAQDTLQTVYYQQGAQPQVVQYQPQPQNQAQPQYQSHPQTQSHPQYQPQQIYQPQQFQPQSTNQQSAVYYSPQSHPQTSQNYYQAQPVQPAQTSQQVYTIGSSPHRQIQSQPQYQNMTQRQPQQAPQSQQLFFSPSQQSPPRVVYASSTQGQSGVTPQYQPIQQAASPTRVVQYSPQTSHQSKQEPIIQPQVSVRPVASQPPPGQQVSYQPQQTMYAAPTQPQVIRMNQNPVKQQQQFYVQNVAPIDRGAYQTPTVANQQAGSYQPMGKAVPVTMATPPQQYQPPQQQPSLSQSVPAQQQRPIPQTQPRPQPPPTSPTGATPKFRQLWPGYMPTPTLVEKILHHSGTVPLFRFRPLYQPRRSMDRGYNNAPPQFVQQPASQVTVNEGDSIILKAVVKPAGDPTLDVQWLKNGVVLSASSRHNAVLDRGYAEFQFLYTNTTDSGEYVCVAKTDNGTAQSSPCQVTIVPEDSVITDSQLPEESMIMNLAAMENQLAMNDTSRREDEVKFTTPPQFLRPLLPQINLKENERAKFETFVQPSNDPSMTVEWFKDGEPLKTVYKQPVFEELNNIFFDVTVADRYINKSFYY
ncbi:hypothetical protein ACTXT7_015514, partial [Hymenolepis weldensis]